MLKHSEYTNNSSVIGLRKDYIRQSSVVYRLFNKVIIISFCFYFRIKNKQTWLNKLIIDQFSLLVHFIIACYLFYYLVQVFKYLNYIWIILFNLERFQLLNKETCFTESQILCITVKMILLQKKHYQYLNSCQVKLFIN